MTSIPLYTIRLLGVLSALLFIAPAQLVAQPPEGRAREFYERYHQVYTEVFASDAQEAMRLADSLYQVAETDAERMQTLILKSMCYRSKGDMGSALFVAMEAKDMAEKSGLPGLIANAAGFLANSFIAVGLSEQAKVHLKDAETSHEQAAGTPHYFLTKGNLLQDRARIEMEHGEFEAAIAILEEAGRYMAMDTINPIGAQISLTNNHHALGIAYLQTGQYDKADAMLRLSEQQLEGQDNRIRPYIYTVRAEIALQREQYDSVQHYVQLMQPYLEQPSPEDRRVMYELLAKYYKATHQHEQSVRYSQMLHDMARTRERNAQVVWEDVVGRLNAENASYRNKRGNLWWIIAGAVVVGLCAFWFVWFKRKEEKRLYLELVEKHKEHNRAKVQPTRAVRHIEPESEYESKDLQISPDTETRLLEGLEKMEESAFFLDKEMTLATMAHKMGTNQRYVSYMIRKYKEKDFNTYLQHMRVHYIIDRIRLEPGLLEYKLSYLADIAGFASHSKFSSVFKAVTGIPPSVFIHYTKEESMKEEELVS